MTLNGRIPGGDVFRSPAGWALPFFLVPESAWCHPSSQKGASPWRPPPTCPLPVREGITAAHPRHRLAVFFSSKASTEDLVSPTVVCRGCEAAGRRHALAWAGFLEHLLGSASRSVGLRHPSLTGALWPSTVVLDVTWP